MLYYLSMDAKEKYDQSLEAFRVESRKFRGIQRMYRDRLVGDAEYLAARKAFILAMAISDEAEKAYLSSIESN